MDKEKFINEMAKLFTELNESEGMGALVSINEIELLYDNHIKELKKMHIEDYNKSLLSTEQPTKQVSVPSEEEIEVMAYASATDSIQDRKLDEILSILKRKENVLGHTPMELAQSFALFCWGKTITTELKTIEALFLRWIDECGILNGQKQS